MECFKKSPEVMEGMCGLFGLKYAKPPAWPFKPWT